MSGRAKRREALRKQTQFSLRNKQGARRRAWFVGGVFVCASTAMIMATLHLQPQKNTVISVTALAPSEKAPSMEDSSIPDTIQSIRDSPFLGRSLFGTRGPTYPSPQSTPYTNLDYPTLEEIIAMTPDQLAKVDIVVVNLRCAEGLPGAETIDMAAELKKIDDWAGWIEKETNDYAYLLRKHPDRYQGIEGKYRMDMLTTVLHQDIGIHYDPDLITIPGKEGPNDEKIYRDARNVFINGLTGRLRGTCASMPALYLAIGRRLGYPLRLFRTNGHSYLQWNDGRTKFNIETTSQGGLMSYPDEYYWHWPYPISPKEAERYDYFTPMSPRDELAAALNKRAIVLMSNGRMLPAVRCQQTALDITEHNKAGMNLVLKSMRQFMAEVQMEQMHRLLDQRDGISPDDDVPHWIMLNR